jgi:hypothetical protein
LVSSFDWELVGVIAGNAAKSRDGSLIFTPDQLLWGVAGPTTIPDAPGQ